MLICDVFKCVCVPCAFKTVLVSVVSLPRFSMHYLLGKD